MKNLKKNLILCIKTMLVTMFCVLVGVSICIYNLAMKEYNIAAGNIKREEVKIDGTQIQELINAEKENPDDYSINIKLALLYEKMQKLELADLEYKKALMKSPRSEYTLYKYASFCIRTKRYADAIGLIENIPDSPSKKTVAKKLAIYEKIAQDLTEIGDYQNSSKIYNMAYKYAKILSISKSNEILAKLENSYLLLADEDISRNNYEQAKIHLETLLKLKESILAEYKLALIYKSLDVEKSAYYMEKVFKKDFKLVNMEVYYDVLNSIVSNAENAKDYKKAKYYIHKQNRIKKFIENNLVFSDDFIIENASVRTEGKIFPKKWLSFDLTNRSPLNNGILYVKIEIKYPNGKQDIKYFKADYNKESNAQKQTISLEIRKDGSPLILKKLDYAQCSMYIRKNLKYDWILINTFNVKYE